MRRGEHLPRRQKKCCVKKRVFAHGRFGRSPDVLVGSDPGLISLGVSINLYFCNTAVYASELSQVLPQNI